MEGVENQMKRGDRSDRVHTPGSAARHSDQLEEEFHFDQESVVIRRADADDTDAIINLVEIGEDDIYNRVYSYPKILKLIETSYLAITVIDRHTGTVIGFAAFEDFPQGQRGMTDDKHYNLWEEWFRNAYRIQEFTALNTLWLAYFIAGGSAAAHNQHNILKQVFQTVYTSLPDLIGILFLVRGDADEDDIRHCFEPVSAYFQKLALKDREQMATVRGIHKDSEIYFSSRVHVVPYIEIRKAKQEDHDDLADVFNSQSETVTEAYGEYFIAELIASQNETNQSLVAQVKDKAVGLMGLTKEVDLKLLHKCFELDTYDNLLKQDYMDAIRARRAHMVAQQDRVDENEVIAEKLKLKYETMKCNVITQRIQLQEHLLKQKDEIMKQLEDMLGNEEEAKSLTLDNIYNEFFRPWITGFSLHQPSDYFNDKEDDVNLVCSIQSEYNFMISTLEIFGLPQDYLSGGGHFATWSKQTAEGKDKKKKAAKGKAPAKVSQKMQKLRAKNGMLVKEERPTHFDLQPIQKALTKFLNCTAESRSQIRTLFAEKAAIVRNTFKDARGEVSFKKIMDVRELAGYLNEAGLTLEPHISESLGALLLCFGDIEVDRNWQDRAPPETDEQRKARTLLQLKHEERKKTEEERQRKLATGLFKTPTEEEELKMAQETKAGDLLIAEWQKIMKPAAPIKQMLDETSIHDFLLSLDRMAEYDRMCFDIKMISFDNWNAEDKILTKLGKPYFQQYVQLPELSTHIQYSNDSQIQSICEQINDLKTIPDPVESAKNAFAVTLFCMESAFDSRSKDFLKYAFELFPDRDYLIVTQPHTIAENALLNKFSIVGKKSENTFSHVLYILHRDQLYEQDMSVTRSNKEDFDQIQALITSSGISDKETNELLKEIISATTSFSSPNLCFCARIEGMVIATFLISKDVNLEYYISHFHLQDQILLSEHERKGHSRLVFSTINPIFEKSTRFFLKEILRLSGKSCLYFEVMNRTIIPTIFYELIHVRSRRFPHFLDKKWDHERHEEKALTTEEENDGDFKVPVDGADRKADDEEESPFALCFTTKRLLSEAKIVKNARIVVVGASDTGISFVEALLSISYLQFTNITLIAPGGLPHHHLPKKSQNLKVQSTSYTNEDLKKLMLETRITVLNSRMVDIDRSDKNIILNDGRVVPYDTLVLGMGIQEKTLDSLKYASWGINPQPEGIRRCKGVLSIDDPYIYETLNVSGPLMQKLTDRRRQTKCVVYGRTLNVYTTIQGLVDRGVQYKNIVLAIPKQECHVNDEGDAQITEDMPVIYQNAFDDMNLEEKTQKQLESKGVQIIKECRLIEIITDKDQEDENKRAPGSIDMIYNSNQNQQAVKRDDSNQQLDRIVLKRLDIPDEEEEEDEIEIDEKSQSDNQGDDQTDEKTFDDNERSQQDGEAGAIEKKKKRKKNELEIECSVLITAGHRDVDYDVFNSIHNNGLVYNGRLIVDKNFQTTDPSIFAAGSLCEFSGRYAALSQGRSLRMDRYNGREMGSRLANSVFDLYDPQTQNEANQNSVDELPLFYLPSGQGGILPNGLVYYHIKTTNPLKRNASYADVKNRADLVCDNLDMSVGKGHYIRFSFNSIGLIESVTYMGHEEVILQSLWSFVGLHESYLNSLTSRFDAGIIPNVVEFLSENWAIGLYHEWFGNFCLRMREGIKGLPDIVNILNDGFAATEHGQGITRDQIQNLRKKVDSKTIKYIEDETLEFIKTNMNHLPMYYIPGKEFA